MQKLTRLQLIGPLILLSTICAAEILAYALSQRPSSGLLWYLNVEVFGIFRKSRVALSECVNQPFAQLLIVSPLALLALAGLVLRRNLLIAVSSNLSFVCAGFLVFSWHHWNAAGQVRAASLAALHLPTGNDSCFFILLLFACFVSFTMSHFFYIHLLRSRIS